MSTEIKAYYTKKVNNKVMIIIGDDYVGSPLICYAPDIIVTSQYILNKYDHCFMFDRSNTQFMIMNP